MQGIKFNIDHAISNLLILKTIKMKIKPLLLLSLILSTGISSIVAQGFVPPSESKAVVYFTRSTSVGGAITFQFFQNDQYIGEFKGKNYMRYECDPGEQLLWASSENQAFVSATLEAGKTYVINVKPVMGGMKARVKLIPLLESDEDFNKAKKIISSESPVTLSDSDNEKKKEKRKAFIAMKLKAYENEEKGGKNDLPLTAEMAISEEAMK